MSFNIQVFEKSGKRNSFVFPDFLKIWSLFYKSKSFCSPRLSQIFLFIFVFFSDRKLRSVGLARVAVFTDGHDLNQYFAALHFVLRKRSLEEALMLVKIQYERLERDAFYMSNAVGKPPPIFQIIQSNRLSLDAVTKQNFWDEIPQFFSAGFHGMLEAIARVSKSQINLIHFERGQEPKCYGEYGPQNPESSFCVVQFIYDGVLKSAVTAQDIQ